MQMLLQKHVVFLKWGKGYKKILENVCEIKMNKIKTQNYSCARTWTAADIVDAIIARRHHQDSFFQAKTDEIARLHNICADLHGG